MSPAAKLIQFTVVIYTCNIHAKVGAGNTKRGRINVLSFIDLLFDWLGLVSFANKNKNCQLSYSRFQTSQTRGQWYSDTSPFSIPWLEQLTTRQAVDIGWFWPELFGSEFCTQKGRPSLPAAAWWPAPSSLPPLGLAGGSSDCCRIRHLHRHQHRSPFDSKKTSFSYSVTFCKIC